MEYWSFGVLEYWSSGVLEYFITPVFNPAVAQIMLVTFITPHNYR
jgi:hypothetical protein